MPDLFEPLAEAAWFGWSRDWRGGDPAALDLAEVAFFIARSDPAVDAVGTVDQVRFHR